jgi:hypothetical protein
MLRHVRVLACERLPLARAGTRVSCTYCKSKLCSGTCPPAKEAKMKQRAQLAERERKKREKEELERKRKARAPPSTRVRAPPSCQHATLF